MNLPDFFPFLDPMQEQFSRIFSIFSGALVIIICLWMLNFIIGLIQRIYSIGKAIGTFYRNYLHGYLQSIIRQSLTVFNLGNSQSQSL